MGELRPNLNSPRPSGKREMTAALKERQEETCCKIPGTSPNKKKGKYRNFPCTLKRVEDRTVPECLGLAKKNWEEPPSDPPKTNEISNAVPARTVTGNPILAAVTRESPMRVPNLVGGGRGN